MIVMASYSCSDVIFNVLSPTFSKKRFWTWSVIIWIESIVTTLPPFVGWSSYGYVVSANQKTYTCGRGAGGNGLWHALYLPFFYFINFVLPALLVILCFSRIVRTVQRQRILSHRQSNVVMLANVPSSSAQTSNQPSTANQAKAIVRSKAFLLHRYHNYKQRGLVTSVCVRSIVQCCRFRAQITSQAAFKCRTKSRGTVLCGKLQCQLSSLHILDQKFSTRNSCNDPMLSASS